MKVSLIAEPLQFLGMKRSAAAGAPRGLDGEGVREEILTEAVAVVGRRGYEGATVREVATAVGLSPAGVLHHFSSKDELFGEALRRRDRQEVARFAEAAGRRPRNVAAALTDVVRSKHETPGLVLTYAQLVGRASRSAHPEHDYLADRLGYARKIATRAFRQMHRDGFLPRSIRPEVLAGLMLALEDGLHVQWLIDPSTDVPEHIAAFFRLLELAAPAAGQTR